MTESTVETSTEASVEVVGAPTRVLNVDDDSDFLKITKQILEVLDAFQVDTALSADEAMDKLKKSTYDVIVSDYQMPEKDGLQFLKELRESGNTIHFILFTGKGRESSVIQALNLGADGYFNKMGDPETVYGELAHGIRQAVEGKKAKDELIKSRVEYASLLGNIPGMVYRARPDWSTEIVSNSEYVCRYAIEDFSSGKVNWFSLIHPDDKDRVIKESASITKNPESIVQEYRILDREAEVRWVRDYKTSFFSENDVFKGIDGVVFDITERKKTEKALQESEEEFKILAEESPNMIYVNIKSRIVYANKRCEEITGYKREEFYAQDFNFLTLIAPEFKDLIKASFTRHMKSEDLAPYEYTLLTKEGKRIEVIGSTKLIRYGGESAILGLITDITELKKAENTIQRQNEFLKNTLEALTHPLYVIDADDYTIQLANSASGFDDRLKGSTCYELTHKRETPCGDKHVCPLEEVKKTKRSVIVEHIHYDEEGQAKNVEVHGYPILDENGNVIQMIEYTLDITERKRAKEAIEDLARFPSENPNPVLRIRGDSIILYANSASKSWLGAWGSEIGGSVSGELSRHVTDVLSSGMSEVVEYAFEERVFSFVFTPVVDAGYVNAYGRDITERKRMEEEIKQYSEHLEEIIAGRTRELHESEKKYRDLVDTAPVGVYQSTIQGDLLYSNQALADINETLIGETLDGTVKNFWKHPEQRVQFIQYLQQTGHITNFEYDILTKQGKTKHLLLSGTLNGEIITGMIIDVTERQRLEEHLRASEQQYRNLVDNALVGVFQTTLAGDLVFANPTLKAIYGLDASDDLTSLKITSFWKNPEQRMVLVNALKQMGKVTNFQHDLLTTTGETKHVLVNGFLVDDLLTGTLIDITDRITLERKLLQSETNYRDLFEDAPVALWVEDYSQIKKHLDNIRMSGVTDMRAHFQTHPDEVKDLIELIRVLDVNSVALQLYESTSKADFQQNFRHVFPEESITSFIEELVSVSEGRTKFKDETVNHTLTGKRIQIHLQWSTAPGFEDTFARRLVSVIDVTEQKVLEQLAHSEERLRMLFEYAPDAIYLNDLKGTFVDGNKAAEELTGYKRSELIGKSFLKLKLLPSSKILKAVKLLAENVLRRPTGPDEFILNRKDGVQVHVEIRTFPVKIEDQTLVLGIARDITERKKAENALQESEERYRSLFESSREGIIITGSESKITRVNSATAAMLGYNSPQELVGIPIVELYLDPEARTALLKKIVEKGYVERYEVTLKKRDGSPIHVLCSALTRRDEEGNILQTEAFITDITDRKKTFKKLETLNEKLEVVGRMTRHDVNNKLASVRANVYLVKQGLTGDQALKHLSEIESAVEQTTQIFDSARIYERLGVEELDYVNVGEAVEGARKQFSSLNVRVANDCGGLRVLADSMLSRLFYNLIDNSVKHGLKKVTNIRVYYEEMRDSLLLVYEDGGVGIPRVEKEKIFEQGYGKGSGLGLYLIMKMCEVYGWNIKETGKSNKGVKFIMTLPKVNVDEGKTGYQLLK